jgi:copper(I)-binding protein
MPNMPDMTTPGAEMTMAPVPSVALPKGEPVVFEPGGKHIMLTGLTAPLTAGGHFPLTLALSSGATVDVDVLIGDNPPGG